jgi:hypothetical protein
MVDLEHKRPHPGEGGNAAHAHEVITTLGTRLCAAYMYKVVRSVNLEAYALTVQFQQGAMGYITAGVMSRKRQPLRQASFRETKPSKLKRQTPVGD